MRLIAIALAFVSVTSLARAQEEAAPEPLPPPPPPVVTMTPPLPPPYISTLSGHELVRRGHRKKVAGGVLMGIGSAMLAGGMVLVAIDSASHHPGGPLEPAGQILGLVGAPLILAGIPTYIVGGYQMDKGRRLQLSGFAAAPTFSSGGVDGGAVSARFRF